MTLRVTHLGVETKREIEEENATKHMPKFEHFDCDTFPVQSIVYLSIRVKE